MSTCSSPRQNPSPTCRNDLLDLEQVSCLQVQVPSCPNVLSAAYLEEVADGTNVTVCTEQQINLNGSAVALYNDTSYYDDLTFAATWLYRATGDSAYLTEAETWYVAHLYGTTTTSSVSITFTPP